MRGTVERASRPECENSSAESRIADRPAGKFANSSVRFKQIDQLGTFAIDIVTNSGISLRNYISTIDRFLSPLRFVQ